MIAPLLSRLGVVDGHSGVAHGQWLTAGGEMFPSINPATGEVMASVASATTADYEQVVAQAVDSFRSWRMTPAPQRGELVRRLGQLLRRHKEDLGLLVTLETGKILSEGLGEVQEMIDMCDFAVGLSRQLYGLTMPSERPAHRLFEQWHPLGPVGIITAFNFPVAVWSWNAALAAVCGDTLLWKPSHRTPLCSLAVQQLCHEAMREVGVSGVFNLVVGDGELGAALAADARLPLVSFTGSTAVGKKVSATVAGRLGRSLLELGGNNAVILTESAPLDLALRAVVFAAVGTAGQRCTSLRRLIVHESIADRFAERLIAAYRSVRIGNPWESGVLLGPLVSEEAVLSMQSALERARQEGAEVLYGGERLPGPGYFVRPALVRAAPDVAVLREETFAPILYLLTYRDLDEAIAWQNSVEQGLSSALFTDSLQQAEHFLSPRGSDCGIANINIGTSGAEIGGAFGGEKATGGGREAGSDAWKTYMRRQTCTINGGQSLPLAQGVHFNVE